MSIRTTKVLEERSVDCVSLAKGGYDSDKVSYWSICKSVSCVGPLMCPSCVLNVLLQILSFDKKGRSSPNLQRKLTGNSLLLLNTWGNKQELLSFWSLWRPLVSKWAAGQIKTSAKASASSHGGLPLLPKLNGCGSKQLHAAAAEGSLQLKTIAVQGYCLRDIASDWEAIVRSWGGQGASEQGEIVRDVKEVMAVVTLMQPEAQEANEQYRWISSQYLNIDQTLHCICTCSIYLHFRISWQLILFEQYR